MDAVVRQTDLARRALGRPQNAAHRCNPTESAVFSAANHGVGSLVRSLRFRKPCQRNDSLTSHSRKVDAMNASLTTRIALPVLALVVGMPVAAQANPYGRSFDYIERYADISADRARHMYSDILHDVHDRRLKSEMTNEARSVMNGFMQIRVLARQQRVGRMGDEVHRVMDCLTRLDHLVHEAERVEDLAHRGRGPDVHHIHEIIGDLTARARVLDDLVHRLEGPPPPIRYETNYRQPRAVYSRGRPGFDATPSGVYIGGRGLNIEFGTR